MSPTDADLLRLLHRAVNRSGDLVAGVRNGQWSLPTPCPEFDVADLVGHLVGGLDQFADVAAGRSPAPRPEPIFELADAGPIYQGAARRALLAWRTPGALAAEYAMPWGRTRGRDLVGFLLIESLGHGWDLARATGQAVPFDDELADAVLRLSRGYEGEAMRAPELFGPPVHVASGRSVLDRLVGYLGRDPGWEPAAADR